MRRSISALLLAASFATAHAQPADVPGMIKFVDTAPADMDHAAWKEKRREVAHKLVTSKDRRAVPVLMRLAESETFDIVGEIAIEGLGALGDQQAVPVLQRIANDVARDKNQRDLAAKALKKLGAPLEAKQVPPPPRDVPKDLPKDPTPPPDTTPPPTGDTTKPPPTDLSALKPTDTTGGVLLGTRASTDLPALPEVPDDALAAYERITFAGGSAHLQYDNVRKRTDFDADLAGSYARRVERETMAWGVTGDAHVVAGMINPDGAAQSRGAEVDASIAGEARFYSGKLYGIGKAVGAVQLDYFSDTDNNGNATKGTSFAADLQVALGGGYGRMLDVGAAIRVRRLARALDANKALGKPIDKATAKKLELTWWALRGERTTYRALVATVAILREAGILLGEPDAGLAYELLAVLRDSQLYLRPSGFDAQLVFGEGYLKRPDMPTPSESGRVEQLIVSGGYAAQLDDDKLEAAGTAFARLRLFAPDMTPAPWALGATARLRRFTYAEHGDPLGALDASATVTFSDEDLAMGESKALRITGSVGWTWWINQAGGFRVAANVTQDTGAFVFGLSLQGSYALLDGTFAQ